MGKSKIKKIFNNYAKIFLYTFLVYTGITFIIFVLFMEQVAPIIFPFKNVLIFSVIFSAIMGTLNWDNPIGYHEIRVEKKIYLNECSDNIVKSIEDILKEHRKVKNIKVSGKEITGRWVMSLWSFGEKISVKVESANEEKSLSVKSEPILKTALIDFGKNRKNINQIIDKINTHCSK